ncbi:sulfite exporter TauE/SafE family protein [soil metagenome]
MVVLGICAALLIGGSLGLFGGGGSILTVPTLHYLFGIETHAAITSSLLIVGVTSVVTLVPHLRAGRVRLRIGLVFGASSMVSAYAAGKLASHVPSGVLLAAFALMMVVASLAMLRPQRTPRARHAPGWLVVQGVVVGAITGLVGAGGGFVIVPALVVLVGLPIIEAVATSLLIITLNSFAAFSATVMSVTLDGPVTGVVLAAAIVGAAIGGHVAPRISPAQLRRWFGWLILSVAVVIAVAELPALWAH